jgi:plasmid stabilization system protein ParE
MPLARRQSVRIDLWWRQHRLEAAMAFKDDLATAIESLEALPDRGSPRPRGRRALVLPHTLHLVMYRVRPRARRVEIISIER